MVRRIDPTRPPNFYSAPPEYGTHEWCVKHHDWKHDWEPKRAQMYFLGEYDPNLKQFQKLNELLKRPITAFLAGPSQGWLVVDESLTLEELDSLDWTIEAGMQALPRFLEEERNVFEQEQADYMRDLQENR